MGGDVPSPVDPPSGCVFHPRCPRFHAGHCDVVEPELEPTPGEASHVAACHYPLERWPEDQTEISDPQQRSLGEPGDLNLADTSVRH